MWSNIMSRVSGRSVKSEEVDDLDSSDLAPSCPIPEMRSEPLYDEAEHEVDAAMDSVEKSADFSELGLGRLVPTEYTASPARARQPSVRTFAEGKNDSRPMRRGRGAQLSGGASLSFALFSSIPAAEALRGYQERGVSVPAEDVVLVRAVAAGMSLASFHTLHLRASADSLP
jgi:hypothetical protein